MSLVRLVFAGEILPGHEPEAVKAAVGRLLKLDREQEAKLFSGKRKVLKRQMDPDEAKRYAARLAQAGAKLLIEPEPVEAPEEPMPALSLRDPLPEPPAAAVPAAASSAVFPGLPLPSRSPEVPTAAPLARPSAEPVPALAPAAAAEALREVLREELREVVSDEVIDEARPVLAAPGDEAARADIAEPSSSPAMFPPLEFSLAAAPEPSPTPAPEQPPVPSAARAPAFSPVSEPIQAREPLPAAPLPARDATRAGAPMPASGTGGATSGVAATGALSLAPLSHGDAPAPGVIAAATPPTDEQIVCPNCGEQQSRRVLCRNCSTDMPRAFAARAQDAELAREQREAALRARRGQRPLLDGAGGGEAEGEAAALASFSLEGRLPRLPYLMASCLAMMGTTLLALLMLKMPSAFTVVVGILGGFILFLWWMRASMVRLHDVNRSGWWALLLLLPAIGVVLWFVYHLWPGTRGDNDYGEQPRRTSEVGPLIAVVLMCGTWAMAWDAMTQAVMAYAQQRAADMASHPGSGYGEAGRDGEGADPVTQAGIKGAALEAFKGPYLAAPSHKAFAVSSKGAYGWKGDMASPQDAMAEALAECDARREAYTAKCRVVSVDGRLARAR